VLSEYRLFRRKCLEYLRGDTDTSVMNQIYGLSWHTAVYRTLNEARRLEPDRVVNGAMWGLLTAGYANLTYGRVRTRRSCRPSSIRSLIVTRPSRRPRSASWTP